jgi:superfamily II DNA or RNA helicase
LVLAHGQDVLRKQFGNAAVKHREDVVIVESSKNYAPTKELTTIMIVTLPQTICNVDDLGYFDLIVVDEAHQFYNAAMVAKIIEKLPNTKQLLLSASPFSLRQHNFPEIAFTLDKALSAGVMTNARIEILVSALNLSFEDYTENGALKEDKEFNDNEVNDSMDKVMLALIDRLSDKIDNKTLRNLGNLTKISKLFKNLDKTIIAASSCNHAEQIGRFLKDHGIKHLMSDSKVDKDSINIDEFKKDLDCKILVVVNRGRLGFNMPELVNMVDMTGSVNPTLIYQMLGRVTRLHPNGAKKRFFKITNHKLHYYHHATMCITAGLCTESFYMNYDESQYRNIKIPTELVDGVLETKNRKGTRKRSEGVDQGDSVPDMAKSSLDLATTVDVFNKINYDTLSDLDTSAFTTLSEIKSRINGTWKEYMGGYENMLKYVKGLGVTGLMGWIRDCENSYKYALHRGIQRKIAEALEWSCKTDGPESKKALLRERRKQGLPKPNSSSKDAETSSLAKCLRNYTNPSSYCYDQEFAEEMRNWESETTIRINKTKNILIEQHDKGLPRPSHRSKDPETRKLGTAADRYTGPSSDCYDPEFCSKIPNWINNKPTKETNE